MDDNLSLADWYGRRVQVVIDRPLGSAHPEDESFIYELNYGFIPETTAPDGDPIDIYVIDADDPLAQCEVEIIAIIRRRDDVEDKLVGRIGNDPWSSSEIAAKTDFQEQWFDTFVETATDLEHAYTNRVVRAESTIVKVYAGPDSAQRQTNEESALRSLPGQIPIPEIIGSEQGRLQTRWVSGTHGKDLMTPARGAAVLTACGATLRRIHSVDVTTVFPEAPSGLSLVHGDYGPNNVLLHEASMEVVAVIDWEWAHPGNPIEDVAWCEWIVRTFHPDSVSALGAFFSAYGARPPWPERQTAMLAKLHQMHRFTDKHDAGGHDAATRQRQIGVTKGWTGLDTPEPT